MRAWNILRDYVRVNWLGVLITASISAIGTAAFTHWADMMNPTAIGNWIQFGAVVAAGTAAYLLWLQIERERLRSRDDKAFQLHMELQSDEQRAARESVQEKRREYGAFAEWERRIGNTTWRDNPGFANLSQPWGKVCASYDFAQRWAERGVIPDDFLDANYAEPIRTLWGFLESYVAAERAHTEDPTRWDAFERAARRIVATGRQQ